MSLLIGQKCIQPIEFFFIVMYSNFHIDLESLTDVLGYVYTARTLREPDSYFE